MLSVQTRSSRVPAVEEGLASGERNVGDAVGSKEKTGCPERAGKDSRGRSRNFPEKARAPHSRTLVWKIPWTEEPGGLQSTGSRRVRHD